MDSLKQIPQIYHDLLSRIIPGLIALYMLTEAIGRDLGDTLSSIYKGSQALQSSVLTLLLTATLISYLCGHLIGNLSEFWERLIRKIMPHYFSELRDILDGSSRYSFQVVDFYKNQTSYPEGIDVSNSQILSKMIFIWFDWLKINSPEAGARCAKVRAEYRMLSGLSIVALLSLISHIVHVISTSTELELSFIIVAALLVALFAWGYARMARNFQWAVINQYFAAYK